METNMIKMPERLMDAYNGGDYAGGGAVGFSRINDYIYKINDDDDTADVSRLILVCTQLLRAQYAVYISTSYGDGRSIVYVCSIGCG